MDNPHANNENAGGDTNVNNIAASLQALLGIPPINKSSTTTTSSAGAGALGLDNKKLNTMQISNVFPSLSFASVLQNKQGLSNSVSDAQSSHIKDIGSVSTEITDHSHGRHSTSHRYQTDNSGANSRSTHNSSNIVGSPVGRPDPRNESYETRAEKPTEPMPFRSSGPHHNDRVNEMHHNRRPKFEPRNQENRPKRSGTPIKQLLDQPDCPNDLRNYRNLLIDASLHEHKPTYLLHAETLIKLLRSRSIEPLKKKSPKFPRAKYICDLCNYHMDTIYNVISHILNPRHQQNSRRQEVGLVLSSIGPPSQAHQIAMTRYILKIVEEHGISNQEISDRKRIVDQLNFLCTSAGIPCNLTLFGSSASGFGFKSSDVNINITMELKNEALPDSTEQAQILNDLYRTLHNSPNCKDVTELFSAKLISIKFNDASTGKLCVIHANNTSGVSLSRLFAEYDKCDSRVRPILIMFRYFAKLAQIDNQNEGTLPSHCYNILALHYLQACGVVPNLHRILGKEIDEAVNILDDFASAEEACSLWKTKNHNNIGFLWLDLLNYYSVRFEAKEEVVSITHDDLTRKSDNLWNRKLSIQDPILRRSNLSRSLSSNKICDYIIDRFCITFRYFAIPRSNMGPLYDGIIPEKVAINRGLRISRYDKSNGSARYVPSTNYLGQNILLAIFEDVQLIHERLEVDEYIYDLSQNIIQAGEKPPKICKSCGTDGHLKKNCPDETVPIIRPVRMPSNFTIKILSEVMWTNYDREALNEQDVQLRQTITNEICNSLKPAFPDVDLTMFGSTYNGFGLHLSDVDICLRFIQNPINKATMTQEEITKLLTTVVERLKATGSFQNILPIPSAKVPIVKFTHHQSKLEGDISLSNILALHNTKMLATYCAIDNRLKVLGCFLKKVTKLCDVSDASKGSLSSYGFVLMLIHFLQQHNPPVLPVLQELPPQSTIMVDGCNAWFYDDIQSLKNVWPEMGCNQESVAQLWLAFLVYYTEIFNFEEHIIQIHQKNCVTRFSQLWLTDTLIAIQDPFDHSHNLGAGLSRRMGVYIVKCFQRFRDTFHMSVDHTRTNDWMDFFLNLRRIRGNSNPPIDRQCRICNRIGHLAKNCTQNLVLENGIEDEAKPNEEEAPFGQDEGNASESKNAREENNEMIPWPAKRRESEGDYSPFKELESPSKSEQTGAGIGGMNGLMDSHNKNFVINSPFDVFNDPHLLMNKFNLNPSSQTSANENKDNGGKQDCPRDGMPIVKPGMEIDNMMRTIYSSPSQLIPGNSASNQTGARMPEPRMHHGPQHGPMSADMINRGPMNPTNNINLPPPGFRPLGFTNHPPPHHPMFAPNMPPNPQFFAPGVLPPRHPAEVLEYQQRMLNRDNEHLAMSNASNDSNSDSMTDYQNLTAAIERERERAQQEMQNRSSFNAAQHGFLDAQQAQQHNQPLRFGDGSHPPFNMANHLNQPMVLMSQGQVLQRSAENPAVNPYISHVRHPLPGPNEQQMQQFSNGQSNFVRFQNHGGYQQAQQFTNHYQRQLQNDPDWDGYGHGSQNNDLTDNNS